MQHMAKERKLRGKLSTEVATNREKVVGRRVVEEEEEEEEVMRPICPKPCKPHPTVIPDFLYPHSFNHSHSSRYESSETLDMITRKNDQARESTLIGGSPSWYCGSPPVRVSNPLVHDRRFRQQVELYSQFNGAKLADKLDFTPPPI